MTLILVSQRGFRNKALFVLIKLLRNPDAVEVLRNNTLNDFVFDNFRKVKEVAWFNF